MPLRTVNFATEYWDKVFQCFLAELRAGHTPNPDVLCNREIKFSEFMDFALTMGGQRVATGHYARLETRNGRTRLLKGVDSNKDQSYFLHTLGQSQLSKALFPLGDLQKHTVRAMARRARLSTHDKKDSTGICFIGERPFKDFVKQYICAAARSHRERCPRARRGTRGTDVLHPGPAPRSGHRRTR